MASFRVIVRSNKLGLMRKKGRWLELGEALYTPGQLRRTSSAIHKSTGLV